MAIQRAREDQFKLPQQQRQHQGRVVDGRKATDAKLLMSKKPSSSKVACAKSLRFSGFSTVVLLQPWGKEDRFNSWYSREEMYAFKQSRANLVEALQDTRTATAMKHLAASIEHRSVPPARHIYNKELIRGIEHLLSPEVARHLLRKRRRAIHEVLLAQNQLDHESLAKAYRVDTAFAKEWTSLITSFQDA
mmetsp:Transcript_5217/g.8616  ORF Transcript_5217/g.8616 Transcript_5217/m.8616 type:complete len:191 (+) Transcript_5217:88-660(+)|eukprot:scaffold6719_cov152-Skeletonema_menzelii.AAC.2